MEHHTKLTGLINEGVKLFVSELYKNNSNYIKQVFHEIDILKKAIQNANSSNSSALSETIKSFIFELTRIVIASSDIEAMNEWHKILDNEFVIILNRKFEISSANSSCISLFFILKAYEERFPNSLNFLENLMSDAKLIEELMGIQALSNNNNKMN